MYIDIIIMSREIENKQMIYVAKKLFQTNAIEIKYTWVKVFRFIPEFRFLDLARHRFCETCKSGEILGGGGGGV